MRRCALLAAFVVIGATLTGACSGSERGYPSVGAMLANAAPGDAVQAEGSVSMLGELFCPCFNLTSGGGTVVVWYDLMSAEDADLPAVVVSDVDNGRRARVEGILRPDTDPGSGVAVLWARTITPLDGTA